MDEIKLNLVVNEPRPVIKYQPKPLEKFKKDLKSTMVTLKENMELKRDIGALADKWIEINAQVGYYNNSYHTYTLSHIEKKDYGYECRIYCPYGMSFDNLEKLKPIVEHNFPCLFMYKQKRLRNFVEATIVTKPIEDIKYKIVKAAPYEVYLGTGFDSKPVVISMLKFPHIIDTGATGMGKTKMIDNLVTNLLCNCDETQLGLFLIQIDKADQAIYRRCKQTRAYANTVEKALAVTNFLAYETKRRNELFTPIIEYGLGDNLYDYNKKYPNKALPYYYIIVDEYSSLMPDERSNNKEVVKMKKKIQANMEYISQVGRSASAYEIIGLQRGTIDKLPSFIKAMMNVTVSFRQNNDKSSQIAIDSNEAIYLDVREAIVKTNEKIYLKTTTLTNPMIVNFIEKYRVPEDKYTDPFDYESWVDFDIDKPQIIQVKKPTNKKEQGRVERKQQPDPVTSNTPPQIQQQTFDNVNQGNSQGQIVEVNKKNIPGWVDYTPPNPNAKVIKEDPLQVLASPPASKGGRIKRE